MKPRCNTILSSKKFPCPKCKGTLFIPLITCCTAKEIVSFIAVFAIYVFTLVFLWPLMSPISPTWVMVIAYVVFAVLAAYFVYGSITNFPRRVAVRFHNALARDPGLYQNYKSVISCIDDQPLSDVEIYEQLRALSYIYNDSRLRKKKLTRLMKITFTHALDFETDTLVSLNKFDPVLLDYLRKVAKINPDKIGVNSVIYCIKFYDKAIARPKGEIKCAKILIAGLRFAGRNIAADEYYSKITRVAQHLTPSERRALESFVRNRVKTFNE